MMPEYNPLSIYSGRIRVASMINSDVWRDDKTILDSAIAMGTGIHGGSVIQATDDKRTYRFVARFSPRALSL